VDPSKPQDKERREPNLNVIDKTIEEIKTKLVEYSNNPIIRDIIQKVPGIGVPLDIMLAWLGHKVGEQRIVEYMKILFEELEQIDENKLDKDFFGTPDFLDIFLKASENSLKTRHRERVRINCKILIGSINKDKIPDRHYAEDFLSFVADLTPTDIMVGLEIYNQQKNRPEYFDAENSKYNELHFVTESGWDQLQGICKLDEFDFRIALHKLSKAALVKEIGPAIGYREGRYIITPIFLRLMNFVELNANDPLFNLRIRDPE
jgi:hypothetical protein